MRYQYHIVPDKVESSKRKFFKVLLMFGGTQVSEASAEVDLNLKKCELKWAVKPADLEDSLEKEIEEECIKVAENI